MGILFIATYLCAGAIILCLLCIIEQSDQSDATLRVIKLSESKIDMVIMFVIWPIVLPILLFAEYKYLQSKKRLGDI